MYFQNERPVCKEAKFEVLTHLRDYWNFYFIMQHELNDTNEKEFKIKFILVKTTELQKELKGNYGEKRNY